VLRRKATLARYFLGSVQAITTSGQVVCADQSGSRQGGYVFGAEHVIWVVGAQKIVPTLEDALRRLREHALPLEDQRAKRVGMGGSRIGKLVVYEYEVLPDRITTILVNQRLGF